MRLAEPTPEPFGNAATAVITRAEMAAIFTSLEGGASAARMLAEAEPDNNHEQAFFCGAEWALWNALCEIEHKLGMRMNGAGDWAP